MKFFISTLNFSTDARKKISDVLTLMVDEGISNMEISSFHPFESNIEDKLIRFIYKFDVELLLHNFSPPAKEGFLLNLCDQEIIFRKRAKDFIKKRISLTKKLNMDYFSFHGGFRVNYKQGIHEYSDRLSRDEALDLFIDELKEIMTFAEKEKVHIGVENHVSIRENTENLLLYEVEDYKYLFDKIKSDFLHLHLDLGHLKITAKENKYDRDKFIEQLGDKIMAMHVHDNTGIKVDCHAPFNSDFWFGKEQFRHLKNLKYCILETKTYGDMDLINDMKKCLEDSI